MLGGRLLVPSIRTDTGLPGGVRQSSDRLKGVHAMRVLMLASKWPLTGGERAKKFRALRARGAPNREEDGTGVTT